MFTDAEKKKLYAAGISRAMVSYWNVRSAFPTKKMRHAIASALGATPQQIAARFIAREDGNASPQMSALPGSEGPAVPECKEGVL